MPQAQFSLTQWNGGEISPRAEGRIDLDQYGAAARTLRNFIPRIHGPFQKRPGTRFIAPALNNDKKSRLIPFEVAAGDSYVIELSDYKMKFFRNNQQGVFGELLYNTVTIKETEVELGTSGWTNPPTTTPGGWYGGHFRKLGHGFYQMQRVRVENVVLNTTTTISTGVDYYIHLPRAYELNSAGGTPDRLQVNVGANSTMQSSYFAVHKNMGPYHIYFDCFGADLDRADHLKLKTSYWIENITDVAQPDVASITTIPDGAADSWTDANNFDGCLIPTRQMQMETFQLCTDWKDPEASLLPIDGFFAADLVPQVSQVVEYDTPWTSDEVDQIKFVQNGEQMLLFHPDHPTMELQRYGPNAFWFGPFLYEDGPYSGISPFGEASTAVLFKATGDPVLAGIAGETTVYQDNSAWIYGNHAGAWLRKAGPLRPASSPPDESGLWWVKHQIARVGDNNPRNETVAVTPTVGEGWLFEHHPYHCVGDPDASSSFPYSATTRPGDFDIRFIVGDRVCIWAIEGDLPSPLQERTIYFIESIGAGPNYNITLSATASPLVKITLTPAAGSNNRYVLISPQIYQLNIATSLFESSAPAACDLASDFIHIGVSSENGDLMGGFYSQQSYLVQTFAANDFKFLIRDKNDQVIPPLPPRINHPSGRLFLNGIRVIGNQCVLRAHSDLVSFGTDPTISTRWLNDSNRYRIPAIGGGSGYFHAGTFFEQRLVVGGVPADPSRVFFSESGNVISFAPDQITGTTSEPAGPGRTVTDASGFNYSLDSDTIAAIRWLMPMSILMLGTETGLFEISASTNREAVTPTNATAEMVWFGGCRDIQPVRVGLQLVFASSPGSDLIAATPSELNRQFEAITITELADHVTSSITKELSFQRYPWHCLWMVRQDGKLYGCTFSNPHGVTAWHEFVPGGSFQGGEPQVESVATIHNTDESSDRLFMVVKRTIDGVDVRSVEVMETEFDWDTAIEDAWFLDCALPYSGAPTDTLSGLDHLEGETVGVLADGAYLGTFTVTSGAVTLPVGTNATKAVVGLEFTSQWTSLPLEAQIEKQGTLQHLRKRPIELILRLYKSLGGFIGSETDKSELQYRTPSDPMDALTPFTGDLVINPRVEWDRNMILELTHSKPVPFMMLGVIVRGEWSTR